MPMSTPSADQDTSSLQLQRTLKLELQEAASPPGSVEDREDQLMRPVHEALQAEFSRLGQQLRKDLCRELRLILVDLLPEQKKPAALAPTAEERLAATERLQRRGSANEEHHQWMLRHPRCYLAQEYIHTFPDAVPTSKADTTPKHGSSKELPPPDFAISLSQAMGEGPRAAATETPKSTLAQEDLTPVTVMRAEEPPEANRTSLSAKAASKPANAGERLLTAQDSLPPRADQAHPSNVPNAPAYTPKAVSSLAPHRALGLIPSKSRYTIPQNEDTRMQWIGDMVRSIHFERFFLLMNFLSAAFVGIQTNYMATTESDNHEPIVFRVTDIIFLVLFFLEALLRLLVHRVRFFTMTGWAWNVFDLTLVTIHMVEEFIVRTTVRGSDLWSTMLLRFVRVFRTVKLFRVMGYIAEFRMLLTGIVQSCRSFLWALALIALMNYVMATYLVQIISSSRHSGDLSQEGWSSLRKWYSSMDKAVYSLFIGLTGGVDWNDIADPIRVHISPWAATGFIIFMLFGILALMNVVTGTFVQTAIDRADEIKAISKVQQAKQLFKSLDVDASGLIGFQELNKQLDSPEVQRYFRTIDVDLSEARCLFDMLDINDNGAIDFEEFLSGCIRLQGPARSLDLLMIARDIRCAFMRLSGRLDGIEDAFGVDCSLTPPAQNAVGNAVKQEESV